MAARSLPGIEDGGILSAAVAAVRSRWGAVSAVADLGPFRRGSTRPMTLLLAAVGATVTALLELTIGPYLRVGIAEPHLVLVVGIIVTLALDIEAGLVWAFVGGLVLDVLAERPLGSSAFALLVCIGA